MPALKDFLRKRDKIGGATGGAGGSQHERGLSSSSSTTTTQQQQQSNLAVPEFKIVRSTTEVEEEIEAPSFDDTADIKDDVTTSPKKSSDFKLAFRRSSNAALTKDPTAIVDSLGTAKTDKSEKRLSSRLHAFHRRSHSRSTSADTSEILPDDLPDAPEAVGVRSSGDGHENNGIGKGGIDTDEAESREAQWEKRATLLAQKSPLTEAHQAQLRQHAAAEAGTNTTSSRRGSKSRSRSPSLSDKRGDDDIQEAIRLHELGELGLSTAMFGRLGDPQGQNNALAQVLYGLALRHGWGVPLEPERAITYLSLAAANSASVEQAALDAGMRKGGAAKGELVLAMFELANCFRHGWGVKVDRKAARQYYETAANLGDTDAMEEAAWCYIEGFGGPKDKFKAAQYLRLAEERGRKQVGNSWIWKDKYNPK